MSRNSRVAPEQDVTPRLELIEQRQSSWLNDRLNQLDEYRTAILDSFQQGQGRFGRMFVDVMERRRIENILRDIRGGHNLPLRIRQIAGLALFWTGALAIDLAMIISEIEILFVAVPAFVLGSASVIEDMREWQHNNPRPPQLQEHDLQNGLARCGLQREVIPQLLQTSTTSLFIDMSESIIQAVKGPDGGVTNEKLIHLLNHLFKARTLDTETSREINPASLNAAQTEVNNVFSNRLNYGQNFYANQRANPITDRGLIQVLAYGHIIGTLRKARNDNDPQLNLTGIDLEALTESYGEMCENFAQYCANQYNLQARQEFEEALLGRLNQFIATGGDELVVQNVVVSPLPSSETNNDIEVESGLEEILPHVTDYPRSTTSSAEGRKIIDPKDKEAEIIRP